jgi:hypothetical protein
VTPKEINDIVWGIADKLAPLKPAFKRDKIESKIRERIDLLKFHLVHVEAIPPPAETKAMADKIGRRLAALIAEIEQLPEGAAFEFWKAAAMCNFSLKPLEALEATVKVLRSRRGFSGHVNRPNAVCAAGAYELMNDFSKREPSGSDDRPFRTIAEWLFEAVTGRKPKDRQFKRACDNELRRRRGGRRRSAQSD